MIVRKLYLLLLCCLPLSIVAQNKVMTPERLWSLGRVSAVTLDPSQSKVLYTVRHYDTKTEKSQGSFYLLDIQTGKSIEFTGLEDKDFIQWDANGLYAVEDEKLILSKDKGMTWKTIADNIPDFEDGRISPDGKRIAYTKRVLIQKVKGKEIYDDLPNTTAQVYTDLDYRHWDTWSDGKISHVFVAELSNIKATEKDILQGEPYSCPQAPFGGSEDFIFTPDSKGIIYVSKKKEGVDYAQSTNTDLYLYSIDNGTVINLTENRKGYDTQPMFSKDGSRLAWLSMAIDGYEADKNELIVMDWKTRKTENLTQDWDETIDGGFLWSQEGQKIFLTTSFRGTQQLFEVSTKDQIGKSKVKQVTRGNFDLTRLVGQSGNALISTRTDFNHAAELFRINLDGGELQQLTAVNDSIYNQMDMGKSELRMVKTKDGQEMGVWVIYPPHFDKNKKYPTLLYCQGGPQSALTQFYSYRWNFQLMAANGYIIVAPNRRGMPGWGVSWNEAISGDWGGMPMQDYLTAIDEISKESYIDKDRLGCVGASYGGYSVFMLAGMHQGRFKSFIAHDGLFDMKSWYGTTEELWFANRELGGNYWQTPTPKSYKEYNPSNFVQKWDTPILIIQGGLDFRVPIEQGLEAFQAAKLHGIKSKLLYFPNENHWVTHPQNSILWQREFFSWLKETLK